jgi:molecular chaperone IbpA
MTNEVFNLNTKNALWDFPPKASTIGFDRILEKWRDAIEFSTSAAGKYPPYNILETGEDKYSIQIALAGFSREDIEILNDNQYLIVQSVEKEKKDPDEVKYLHRGIAERSFSRTWTVAEHVVVDSAVMENGILTINLRMEIPESKKPKKIDIK